MNAPNGHWDGKVEFSEMQAQLRAHSEEFIEIRSYLPNIERLRGEGITTRAAVDHLSTDVRMSTAEVTRLAHRSAETSDAVAGLTFAVASLERRLVDTISSLERAVAELANTRRTQ